jgi:hypothetical protein
MAASIIINATLNIGAREFVNAFNRKKLTIEEPSHVKSSMRPACLISEALYLDAMVVASLDMARDYSRRRASQHYPYYKNEDCKWSACFKPFSVYF